MARARAKTLFYNIRYRTVSGVAPTDARGSGTRSAPPPYPQHNDAKEYEVEAFFGADRFQSEDYAEVTTPDRAVAEGAFRLLAREYDSVRLIVRYARDETGAFVPDQEYEPDWGITNIPLSLLSPKITQSAVCCSPVTALSLSPERLEERAANLEAMRKARLPKAPRVPRNSPNNGQIMPRLRARILERDNFRCKRCGADATSTALEVDHIVPRAKGGTNDERNLQTLCWACNRGKSDSDPMPHELEGVA